MTVAEARDALGEFAADQTSTGCSHVLLPGAPGRVLAMIVEGRVVRVEIKGGPVATTTGARVGDSESRIATLYPGRVRVEPHKYATGHYLIVSPDAGDDNHRIVFETDGRRVIEYRAGLLPEVAWVEGCG
jgi:hypothetical protein